MASQNIGVITIRIFFGLQKERVAIFSIATLKYSNIRI